MRVGIIGAGPAGATAGYELAKRGAHVDLYEASDTIGGLSRSIRLWNQIVDLGPHRFFSNDARVNRLWLEVVGNDYQMVDRTTRIYYGGKFFNYPLQGGNALRNMGLVNAVRCTLSYFWQQLPGLRGNQDSNDTFENWVVRRFGRRLFEMFFKSYSEKLWGISCQDLDADFAAQRIKKFSLGEAIKSVLAGGAKKHKTLVDKFAYPLQGTGMVYERMAHCIRTYGGQVLLRTPVRRVIVENGRANGLELQDGSIERYDHVISTMPMTLMVKGLPDVPAHVQEAVDSLRFRNTLVVFLRVAAKDLFPDQWLYIHSPDLKTGRLTNFRNWVPELYGDSEETILALEYWCYDEDSQWQASSESLIELASREIRATGLIGDAKIIEGEVSRIRRCYPVYAKGYKQTLEPIVDYLKSIDALHVIGRYGAFKYNNQDHSILMGQLAAENILATAKNDLWSVNTDYESYQESATITETGLVAADKKAA
jgi:protoporphyrinogen oxidase